MSTECNAQSNALSLDLSFLVGKCFVCKPNHKFKYVVFSFWDKYMDHYSKAGQHTYANPKVKTSLLDWLAMFKF